MIKIPRSVKIGLIVTMVATAIGSLSLIARAGYAEPGSEDDPVITLSYVEKRLEQIKYYFDQKFEEINTTNNTGGVAAASFEVVFVEKGKFIYFGESTEVILRAGQATAIASENGGLSNVTIGKDLVSGEEIPANHLVIIPRNDGRGANVLVDSYFMIKGAYTIQ